MPSVGGGATIDSMRQTLAWMSSLSWLVACGAGTPSSAHPQDRPEAHASAARPDDRLPIPPAPTACRAPTWRAIPATAWIEPESPESEVLVVTDRLVAVTSRGWRLRGEIWDPRTNEWSAMPDGPATGTEGNGGPFSSVRVVGTDAHVVALWSNASQGAGQHGAIFDMHERAWKEASREGAPNETHDLVFGAGAYVVAFRAQSSPVGGVRLDPVSNRWLPVAPGAPEGRCRVLGAGPRIVAWCDDGGHVYDPSDDRWSHLPPPAGPSTFGRAAFVTATDEALLVWGDVDCTHHDGAVYSFVDERWTALPSGGPTPCREASPMLFALSPQHVVHIAPNTTIRSEPGGPVWVFDRMAGRWSSIDARTVAWPMPLPDGRFVAMIRNVAAPLVILPAQGLACPIAEGSIPFLASNQTGPIRVVGDEVVAWGSFSSSQPSCPPGAPCLPFDPSAVRVDRGGVAIRF